MTEEAKLIEGGGGLAPEGAGWFVLNADRARWYANQRFGRICVFEGEQQFSTLGINLHVIEPGQPACLYHREDQQEDFLVLSGRCTLLIEGQERSLRAWDLVHCPSGTEHVFIGSGDGPCAVLMVGGRPPDATIHYPVSEPAEQYGASTQEATDDPKEAYAGSPPWEPTQASWPLGG